MMKNQTKTINKAGMLLNTLLNGVGNQNIILLTGRCLSGKTGLLNLVKSQQGNEISLDAIDIDNALSQQDNYEINHYENVVTVDDGHKLGRENIIKIVKFCHDHQKALIICAQEHEAIEGHSILQICRESSVDLISLIVSRDFKPCYKMNNLFSGEERYALKLNKSYFAKFKSFFTKQQFHYFTLFLCSGFLI
ncbi:MAG: hypothetical protein HAW67_00895, partial [Endozoicomonadaceae bacterium]|nr:hypothetical protein [Endozoicomonadaceae bacterium]